MTTFDQLLRLLYEIQGASDPNHPPATDRERLNEIFERTTRELAASGWQPD